MKSTGKILIIGLDGVPYELLRDLSEKGIMPNAGRLIAEGLLRKMESTVPDVSSVAWSSVITGANPAEHGIFGFTDIEVGSYTFKFPNFDDLKRAPFWEEDDELRYAVVNVPSTYPARRLNGVLISGFVAPQLEKAVYPNSLIPDLRRIGYKTDVDSEKAHKSLELFMEDLEKTFEAHASACRLLWGRGWDSFVFIFTGTDRLLHFMWDAYEDTAHRLHSRFMDYFKRVDQAIGDMASKIGAGDELIMLSDHGFERLDHEVYVNHILRKEGFLRLKADGALDLRDIDHTAKAFALDPARIYVNLKGRYPRGSVRPDDRERVIKDLEGMFESLKYDGRKVIRRIYRKEETYRGPYIDAAPDLVLIGNKGFNLRASLAAQDAFSKGIFTGKHTQDNAFLFVKSRDARAFVPERPTVCDVVDVIKRARYERV